MIKTAKQVLSEHGINIMELNDDFNTQLLHAMEEYKNQALEQTPSGYCRWVKASERLPDNENGSELFHLKFQIKHFGNYVFSKSVARRLDGKWVFFNTKSEEIKDVEWLDESPSTIDARQIDEDLINKLSCLLGYLEIWQRGGKYPLEMNDVIKEANEYLSTIK